MTRAVPLVAADILDRRRQPPTGGEIDFLGLSDGTRMRYGIWAAGGAARGTVLLMPGRTEFIEKHYETIADLNDRALNVVIIDWRNQGLSDRPLRDPHRHYLKSFDLMLDDARKVMQEVARPRFSGPYIVMGHSMGAHMALRLIHDHGALVDKAVLCAPMLGINFAPYPPAVAKMMVRMACLIGLGKNYAAGQTPYGAFFKSEGWRNQLTSDWSRFEDEHWQIERNHGLALGGVTFGWLKAAIASMKRVHRKGYGPAIQVPTLIVRCGLDTVVDNDANRRFCASWPAALKLEIPEARHEILKERDELRAIFWKAFDDFIFG